MTDIYHSLLLLRTSLTAWSETPGLDAQTLLAHVLGQPRAWLLSHLETSLTPDQVHLVEAVNQRVAHGEPLPYVIGHWEFFGLDFVLSPQVLIPRPETELLVETALAWLYARPNRRRCVDVGTGSGCIAVSLAANIPNLKVLATDISRAALRIAARNSARHGLSGQVTFLQADLLQPLGCKFDLICANLPYIPTAVLEELPVFRQEPALALDGGPAGLHAISRLVEAAPACLAAGGLLVAEIEYSQGFAARQLSAARFPQAEIKVLPDLSGNDRLLSIQLPG